MDAMPFFPRKAWMNNNPLITPGVRGWLILLAVLVVVAPGNMVAYALSAEREFDSPIVRAFCDRSSAVYDARWAAFFLAETKGFQIVGGLIMLVLWPLLLLK